MSGRGRKGETLRNACRLALVLGAVLGGAASARAAGPPSARKWPAELFGPTTLWEVHLTISAEAWKSMQPTRSGFGGPRPGQPLPPGRVARGGFGFDFEYVKADLVIGNTTL